MNTVSILPALHTDIEAICDLLAELFNQEADFSADRNKQYQAVEQILSAPDQGRILLLRVNAQVVGMVSLLYLTSTAMGGKVAMLEDMIIAAPYRSQGYGRQLLAEAVAFARQQDCLRITLLTDADNVRAQQCYQQQGFTLSAMLPMRKILED